jgi:hypothetical protein
MTHRNNRHNKHAHAKSKCPHELPQTLISPSSSLSPFGINCHKGGVSLGTWQRTQIHVVIVRAEAAKNGRELAEFILELLLPLIKSIERVSN